MWVVLAIFCGVVSALTNLGFVALYFLALPGGFLFAGLGTLFSGLVWRSGRQRDGGLLMILNLMPLAALFS